VIIVEKFIKSVNFTSYKDRKELRKRLGNCRSRIHLYKTFPRYWNSSHIVERRKMKTVALKSART